MDMLNSSQAESFAASRSLVSAGRLQTAVNRMIDEGMGGIEFVTVNTDAQALCFPSADARPHWR